MIIIGYPGIGKSTIAGKYNCIDLESGNFWSGGTRLHDWYVYYCLVAEHLSRQGYTVFVSSHEVVRNYLKEGQEKVVAIYPSIELKDKWIERLKNRFDSTGSDKDYRAWKRAVDRYDEDIMGLEGCVNTVMKITDMNYSLSDAVKYLQD